eukprot:jgi/Chrzof1/13118/Cz07g20160.t1
MPGNAFVYGTLLADEVVSLLIQRVPQTKPATLKGFSRHSVKRKVYPAIVPSENSVVHGKVLLNLSDKELDILDVYESDEYYRAPVKPLLEDGSEIDADVYILEDEYRHKLGSKEWCYDEWRTQHLHKWLKKLSPNGRHPGADVEQ